MGFDVPADDYQRFMGRFSEPLADTFMALAAPGLVDGRPVLDVGCGPGALTSRLVSRLGAGSVLAVDPAGRFVEAVRRRLPGVDVRRAPAEHLPYETGSVAAALAQLVVPFMDDPVAGLREMGRVAAGGGLVAACVWDHAGGTGPLSPFWDAARDADPAAPDESGLAGAREGDLAVLCEAAGLTELRPTSLSVTVAFETFESWWEPFTLGVGPAGAYVATLGADRVAQVRESCRRRLPDPPFSLDATAWAVTARA